MLWHLITYPNGGGEGVGGGDRGNDFDLLHMLTLFFFGGGQNLKFTIFWGSVLFQLFLGYANLGSYLFGHVIFDRYFFFFFFFFCQFQNKAFCNVF